MSWLVSGAVSVSVRRDGQQVSTDAAGERSFTVTDKRPVTWAVAASNRAGATSDEIMVRPVTFGSMASFITSGMEAAGGLWVGQLVIAFVPGLVIILVAVIKGNVTPAPFIVSGGLAPVMAFGFAALFNFTAGYWLAASQDHPDGGGRSRLGCVGEGINNRRNGYGHETDQKAGEAAGPALRPV